MILARKYGKDERGNDHSTSLFLCSPAYNPSDQLWKKSSGDEEKKTAKGEFWAWPSEGGTVMNWSHGHDSILTNGAPKKGNERKIYDTAENIAVG